MNARRIPLYMKACLRSLLANGPRSYLKMLSQSPYTVKDLDCYGVSMLVDVRDPAISKPILALGGYEDGFARRLLSYVHPETQFVDIGANIGFFTLAVAKRAIRGRVWSVEPDDQNVRLLRASIALNGFDDRVEVHHMAASDSDGDVFFSTLGNEANLGARFTAKEESTLLNQSLGGVQKPAKRRARTIDNLMQGQKVDLVKIDVEGYEPAVLAGMESVLRQQRPIVFSEFAPGTIQHISKTDPADMLRFVGDCGYELAIVEEDGGVTKMGVDIDRVLARHHAKQHHLDVMFIPKG
jgi:FkbM family methyltransferase